MGWRFRKSIKIGGVRFNLGKGGLTSVSVGPRGATLSVGKRGVRGTVGIPGSGLSYTHNFSAGASQTPPRQTQYDLSSHPAQEPRPKTGLWIALLVAVGVGLIALMNGGSSPPSPPTVHTPSVSIPTYAPTQTVQQTIQQQRTAAPPVTAPAPDLSQLRIDLDPPARFVTTNQGANVRSAPSMQSTVLRTVVKDTRLQVHATEGNWMRISPAGEDPMGWIHRSLLVE